MINKKILFAASIIALSFSFIIKKEKKVIPPGIVQVTETLFADEVEVYNFAWQEYESWTKEKFGTNSKEHLAMLPDTLVWRQKQSNNEPYVKYYYRHPAYKNYPVVGVSYEQVIAFCKWRTERVKEFYYKKNNKELNIEYRLPSKEEWEMISNNEKEFFANNGKNKKGEMQLNIAMPIGDTTGTANYMADNADVTAPVYSYWKNNFGLFNIFGNVAEMISEKGISKGGSWRNTLEECHAGKELAYSEPTAWLGFRCVCIMLK